MPSTLPRWEWKDDSGVFHAFKAPQNIVMEKAWDASEKSVNMSVGSQKYVIDLVELTQTNTKTNKQRLLRRVGPAGEVTGKDIMWEWQDGTHGFKRYDKAAAAAVESAFHDNALMAKVPIMINAHDTVTMCVHFGHMHQFREGKPEKHRKIRRRVVVHGSAPSSPKTKPLRDATKAKREREEEVVHEKVVLDEKAKKGKKPDESLGTWSKVQSVLVYAAPGSSSSSSVAAFDMDDTLITPKSGKKFAVDAGDWRWLDGSVVQRLTSLHKEGKKIVIISNQAGISSGKANETDIKKKIEALGIDAGVPISALVCTADDEYRKPLPRVWSLIASNLNDGLKVDAATSVYVGDAAGRAVMTMAGRKKDFSCSDRAFAYNCGLPFATPEEFFLGQKPAAFQWPVSPNELAERSKALSTSELAATNDLGARKETEMVVCVGMPASGKSTFSKKHFVSAGYTWANRDTLKTIDKCVAKANESLKAGQSVVIDNTSPQESDRAKYIAVAKNLGVPVRCLYFDTPQHLAQHMNCVRGFMGGEKVPQIAYNMFKSKFTMPTIKEGFHRVDAVPFRVPLDGAPDEFINAYKMMY